MYSLEVPLCQYTAAGQMILEELLLVDVHLHPYELLGWEGLFGTIFMICLSLPIVGIIPGLRRARSAVATSFYAHLPQHGTMRVCWGATCDVSCASEHKP